MQSKLIPSKIIGHFPTTSINPLKSQNQYKNWRAHIYGINNLPKFPKKSQYKMEKSHPVISAVWPLMLFCAIIAIKPRKHSTIRQEQPMRRCMMLIKNMGNAWSFTLDGFNDSFLSPEAELSDSWLALTCIFPEKITANHKITIEEIFGLH